MGHPYHTLRLQTSDFTQRLFLIPTWLDPLGQVKDYMAEQTPYKQEAPVESAVPTHALTPEMADFAQRLPEIPATLAQLDHITYSSSIPLMGPVNAYTT